MTEINFNDDDVSRTLLKALGAELETFCEAHGLKHVIQPFAKRDDGHEVIFNIRIIKSEQDVEALAPEGGAYLDNCKTFRMKRAWLYKSFKEGRHEYEVWGMLPPEEEGEDPIVLTRRRDGTLYLYSPSVVREYMLDSELTEEEGQ